MFSNIVVFIVYGFGGGVVGAIVGTGLGIFGVIDADGNTSGPIGFYAGAALGLVVAAAIVISSTSGTRRAGAAVARAQAEQAAQSRTARRIGAENGLVYNAQRAVEAFEQLPRHLGSSQNHTRKAQHYYADGAFSPFWSAIESAYVDLGSYAEAVRQITNSAQSHPTHVADLVAAGGNPGTLAIFPVNLDTNHTSQVLHDATADLASMVYQAQKVPVFAQIWEQRRTTAAVVAGFANLEQAVNRMSTSMSTAIGSLQSTLDSSGREVSTQLGRIHADAITASEGHLRVMTQLNSRAADIHGEMYRQEWGHYPLT